MAINFDALPSSKPASTIPVGFYKAKIIDAKMRTSQTTGNTYLSLTYNVNNGKGVAGKLFDMQFDSEKEFLRYKLQRFLVALNLNLEGSFELKDLCKLVIGKEFIVDVGIDPAKNGNPERNTINSFEHEIYYPMSAWAALTGAQEPSTQPTAEEFFAAGADDDESPFATAEEIHATDAADATTPSAIAEEY